MILQPPPLTTNKTDRTPPLSFDPWKFVGQEQWEQLRSMLNGPNNQEVNLDAGKLTYMLDEQSSSRYDISSYNMIKTELHVKIKA